MMDKLKLPSAQGHYRCKNLEHMMDKPMLPRAQILYRCKVPPNPAPLPPSSPHSLFPCTHVRCVCNADLVKWSAGALHPLLVGMFVPLMWLCGSDAGAGSEDKGGRDHGTEFAASSKSPPYHLALLHFNSVQFHWFRAAPY